MLPDTTIGMPAAQFHGACRAGQGAALSTAGLAGSILGLLVILSPGVQAPRHNTASRVAFLRNGRAFSFADLASAIHAPNEIVLKGVFASREDRLETASPAARQQDHDDQQQNQAAARVISPARAVGIERQAPQKQEDEDDEQKRAEHGVPLLMPQNVR